MLTDIAKTMLNPPKLEDLGLVCDKVLQMPETAISKQIKEEPTQTRECTLYMDQQTLNAQEESLGNYYYQT